MTLGVFKAKLLIALKASRPPVPWLFCFLLLGNSMMHSHAIPTRMVLPLVVLHTFTFSIPVCIGTRHDSHLVT
jgi:hypothetical protein